MSNPLQELKDHLNKTIHGMTVDEAHAQKICISCKQSIGPKLSTTIAIDEWNISGLCSECFAEHCRGGEE